MAGEGESQVTPISEIFDGASEPAEKSASVDDQPEEKDEKDEKPEGDQKFPESNSSQDDESGEKPEETDEESEKTSDESDDKKGEQKKDEKKEEKPSQEKDKWESEDNPYQKRYKDTAANWNREHQEKLALQQQVQQLSQELTVQKKIADGTYDPEKDDPSKQVSAEDIATQALNVGKMLASRNAAISLHGEEKVNQTMSEFNEIFGKNQLVQAIVLGSESPALEVFHMLERHHFETKYGTKPGDWLKNIRAEVEKELEPKIRKTVTDELMGRLDKKKKTPSGLPSRGSNGLDSGQNSKGKGPTPLKKLFN